MKIRLIGNYAPPFEEENLYNLSILKRLEDEGHTCTVFNISENPSTDNRFIDVVKPISFVLKLIRHGWRKHVIHFSTKGYLRVGLLKLMISVLIGAVYRAKTVITLHSEFFSVQGQMRSPFGGTQTLYTAFTTASKIVCSDKETYDIASMYMKRPNFELIPAFIQIPDEVIKTESHGLKKLKEAEKVIVFSNVKFPSFIFEIIKELLKSNPFPEDVKIVISFSEKQSSKLEHVIEEAGKKLLDRLIFIDNKDLKATLLAYSKAGISIRPMTCDGGTYYNEFAVSIKKLENRENEIYFPGGLLLFKEGNVAATCGRILNAMLDTEPGVSSESKPADSYSKIKSIYQGKPE